MKCNKTPTGSHWKKILNEIYNHSPNSWCESNKMGRNEDNHPLARKFKISGHELMLGISFLEDHKLIETIKGNGKEYWAFWKLTEKGFNVALENEKSSSTERLHEIIAIGTVLIASITFFNFLTFKGELDWGQKAMIWGLMIFILVLVITMVGIIWPIINKRINEFFPDKK
ncbi:MAG TPA: hypothetical protein ENH46_07045 [Candidatus Pacearchaeota archaeon]|nr:hypothetical protein [Candidatus Pacearchaeota archaeon]